MTPPATATSQRPALHRDLHDELVLLRAERQRLDSALSAYGDHLMQITSRVDQALTVIADRCGRTGRRPR